MTPREIITNELRETGDMHNYAARAAHVIAALEAKGYVICKQSEIDEAAKLARETLQVMGEIAASWGVKLPDHIQAIIQSSSPEER